MIRFAQNTLLAAALSVVTLSVQAAPNLFEAQASISSLKFEVVDLRPEDGVAAGFLPGKHVLTGSAEWSSGVFAVPGYWPLMLADTGYSVGKVSTQQAIKDVIGGTDFQFKLPDNQAGFGRSSGQYTAGLGVQGSSLLEDTTFLPNGDFSANLYVETQSWVLKPGTEVRITGVFDLKMHNNLTQLTGALNLPSDFVFGPWQQASAGAVMGLSVVGDATGVIVGSSSASSQLTSDTLLLSEQIDQSKSESFVLVARNTGNADVILNSSFGTMTHWTVAGAVPEPSSMALLFAGTGFMAWHVRRRKN